jgi:hypothetical protein
MPDAVLPAPRLFVAGGSLPAPFAVTCMGFGAAYSFSAFLQPLQAEFGALARLGLARLLARRLPLLRPRRRQRARSPIAGAHARWPSPAWSWSPPGWRSPALARSLTRSTSPTRWASAVGIGLSYVPVIGAVQRWFVRQRGWLGARRQRHRRRHAAGAAAGDALHRRLGLARRLWPVLGAASALVGVAMAPS